jgi:hypothetical protein
VLVDDPNVLLVMFPRRVLSGLSDDVMQPHTHAHDLQPCTVVMCLHPTVIGAEVSAIDPVYSGDSRSNHGFTRRIGAWISHAAYLKSHQSFVEAHLASLLSAGEIEVDPPR